MGHSAPRARPALAPPPPQVQPYDVIVCDLRMPELDGPAFSAILTQSGRPWLRKPSPITTIRRAIQDVLQAYPHAEA